MLIKLYQKSSILEFCSNFVKFELFAPSRILSLATALQFYMIPYIFYKLLHYICKSSNHVFFYFISRNRRTNCRRQKKSELCFKLFYHLGLCNVYISLRLNYNVIQCQGNLLESRVAKLTDERNKHASNYVENRSSI